MRTTSATALIVLLLLAAAAPLAAPVGPVGSCKWRNTYVYDYIDAGGDWPTILDIDDNPAFKTYIDWVSYPAGPEGGWHVEELYDVNWHCGLWGPQ